MVGHLLSSGWGMCQEGQGNPQPSEQSSNHTHHPASGASQHMSSTEAESRLPTVSLSVPVVLRPVKGVCLFLIGPQDLESNLWLSSYCLLSRAGVHLYNFQFPLNPLPGAQVLTKSLFFPSYPSMCVSFLQPWSYRSPTSLQLVFSEDCFTGRHIFLCI